MIAGPVIYSTGQNTWSRLQALEFLSLTGAAAGGIGSRTPFMCNGANLCFRRQAFDEVGGYSGSEHLASGDDIFLLHKIKKRYGRQAVAYIKSVDAVVTTKHASGFKSFIHQRIRWASKSKSYNDLFTKITAIVVFLLNLSILTSFVAGFLEPRFFAAGIILLIVKAMADFPIIRETNRIFSKTKWLLWYYPLAVIIYPAYIVLTGMFSLFSGYRWKER